MSFLPFSQSLGFLEIPIIACSVIASVIALERFLFLIRYSTTPKLFNQGLTLVELYKNEPRSTRSEIASLWLSQQQKKLSNGLRLLNIIVLIAPLLGLLGTVVGLIQAFSDISQQPGPVEVSTLANGLSLAMNTTAAGLLIAVPFMVIAQLFYLWIDRLMGRLEIQMNKKSFALDSIDIVGVN